MRSFPAVLFILSIFSLCVGYFLSHIYECGRSLFCDGLLIYAHAIYYGSAALAVVFFFLFIFPHAFKAWQNFALWFLPLAIDTFVSYKGPGGGFMDPLPDPVSVYRWIGGIYVLVSLAIVAASMLRKKIGKSQSPKNSSKDQKIIFWSLWALYVAIIIGAHFFD